jgi:hypothetical protein
MASFETTVDLPASPAVAWSFVVEPIRARITETFTPAGAGSHHCIHYEITPSGPIGRLLAPIACRLMKRSRRLYQERLRAALAASIG